MFVRLSRILELKDFVDHGLDVACVNRANHLLELNGIADSNAPHNTAVVQCLQKTRSFSITEESDAADGALVRYRFQRLRDRGCPSNLDHMVKPVRSKFASGLAPILVGFVVDHMVDAQIA